MMIPFAPTGEGDRFTVPTAFDGGAGETSGASEAARHRAIAADDPGSPDLGP